jgi:hypothetical protein
MRHHAKHPDCLYFLQAFFSGAALSTARGKLSRAFASVQRCAGEIGALLTAD